MPGIGTKPKKGSIKKKKLPEYLGSRKPGSSLSTYLGSRKPGGSSTTPATKPQQPASIKDTKHPGRKGAWRGGQKEGKKESKGQKDIYNKNKAPKSTTTAKETYAKWKSEGPQGQYMTQWDWENRQAKKKPRRKRRLK